MTEADRNLLYLSRTLCYVSSTELFSSFFSSYYHVVPFFHFVYFVFLLIIFWNVSFFLLSAILFSCHGPHVSAFSLRERPRASTVPQCVATLLLWLLDRSLFACGSECDICVCFRNEFVAVRLHKCIHRSVLSYGNRNLQSVRRNVICMAMSRMQIPCQEPGLISMIWSYCVGIRTRIAQPMGWTIENTAFIAIRNNVFSPPPGRLWEVHPASCP